MTAVTGNLTRGNLVENTVNSTKTNWTATGAPGITPRALSTSSAVV
jgi:hypothetical protein